VSNIIIDRTHEYEEVDPEITIIFPDGYKIRFLLQGLSDKEYIRRAEILRRR
jgi:hypothetical protein